MCIYDHPRWQLIPSFEIITIIDLSKLIKLIRGREKSPQEITSCDVEKDLKVLEQTFVQRDENNNFTNASVSPLGLLLQGAEA